MNNRNLMHYLLIVVMMFAPASGVWAQQSSHCDEASASQSSDTASNPMSHQHMVDGNAVQDHTLHHQAAQLDKKCCCDTGSLCAVSCDMANCDLGASVSLFVQTSSYAPVFLVVTGATVYSTELIIRSLTPPSRPPAVLS